MRKVNGVVIQLLRSCDLIATIGVSIPPGKVMVLIGETVAISRHLMLNWHAKRISFLPEHFCFCTLTIYRSAVAIIGYLNGIPNRVGGGSICCVRRI